MYKKVCCLCKVVVLPINYSFFAVLDADAVVIAQSPQSVDADSDEADRKAPLPSGGPNTSTVSKLYNEHREQTMP